MKKLVLLILLASGLLAGCNGGPEPKPEHQWETYVWEVQQFAAWFGEDKDFWFTSGSVATTGECTLEIQPEHWESMTLSTSTTGQWERIYGVSELAKECFYADAVQGVWVLSNYSGQTIFCAWEE